MGRVSKARPSERGEPDEWKQGARRAREIRQAVARQIADHIVESDLTGSKEFVALRIRSFAEAERSGDLWVVRAACMDLAGASGAYLAAIDLRLPDNRHPRTRRHGAATNGYPVPDLASARTTR